MPQQIRASLTDEAYTLLQAAGKDGTKHGEVISQALVTVYGPQAETQAAPCTEHLVALRAVLEDLQKAVAAGPAQGPLVAAPDAPSPDARPWRPRSPVEQIESRGGPGRAVWVGIAAGIGVIMGGLLWIIR